MPSGGTDDGPLVTAVIPARNAARFLGRTLDSVLSQTYRHLEVIVVDDGSIDDTAEVVDRARLDDDRIRLIRTPPNGVAAARNRGITEARGELVACLDADDMWHPDKTAVQVELMRSAGDRVAAVWYAGVTIDERDNIVGLGHLGAFDLDTMARIDGWVLLPLVYRCFMTCSPLMRRSAALEIGGFDERFAASEDWDFLLRFAERHQFVATPGALGGYRRYAGTRSTAARTDLSIGLEMLGSVVTRNPWIPSLVVRWSKAGRYVYAASTATANGEHLQSLRWAIRAIALDPFVLLHPSVRTAARSFLPRRTSRSSAPLRYPNDVVEFLERTRAQRSLLDRVYAGIEQRRHRRIRLAEGRARGGDTPHAR